MTSPMESSRVAIVSLNIGLTRSLISLLLCRTDGVATYTQLLRIAEELGDNAVYGGKMR
jgi:enolase